MNAVDPPRRASFGLSALVALGWCAVALVAVIVGLSDQPAGPIQDCSQVFSCLSPFEEAVFILLLYGGPVLVGVLVVTAVIRALLGRQFHSPIIIGTVSGLCSLAILAGAIAVGRDGQ